MGNPLSVVTGGLTTAIGGAVGGDAGKSIGGDVSNAMGANIFSDIEESFTGRRAKERALDAARDATNQANAAANTAWDRQSGAMEPWRAAGVKALTGLQDGSFMGQDPGYQFRLNEGNNSINSALAARGMGNSGAALKQLTRYGQDFASNEYQNAFNRQNQLANYGNNASVALGNFAGGHATNISNNALGYANAQGAAHMGQANRSAQLASGILDMGGKALGAFAGGGKMTRR